MVLVAAGQLSSSSSLTKNGQLVVKLIEKAVARKVRILFLPEASDYIAKSQEYSSKIVKSVEESPFIKQIQDKLHKLYHEDKYELDVNIGIHEPSPTNPSKVLNTLIYLNSKGEITQRYQKIHLFDVKVTPNAPIVKESNGVEPGNQVLKPFDSPAGKLGLAICYDLRFPELSLRLRSLGAEILTFPSAFTQRTGAAHWHVLARARAIDTQTYVIMAAQTGGHNTISDGDLAQGIKEDDPVGKATRFSYGHSIIVDPWGTVISEVSDVDVQGLQLAVADIDLELVEKVRKNMPLWDQRKPEVFGYEV